jgi:hypothetical protein
LAAPSKIRREDLEAPHVVLLDDPDQLYYALGSFLDLSHAKRETIENTVLDFEHETQHYDAALAVDAAEVVNELAIYSTGRGPFRRYGYQLGTIPLDAMDSDAMAVIVGHPEVLSEGDRKGLDEAGISLEGVAEIAARKGWPMPLSLQESHKNHTPH